MNLIFNFNEKGFSMEKILTFIINNNKLLLLLGSDNDPQFHESFWYVVTGGVEDCDSSLKEAVIREVKEETNLSLTKIIDLNWTFEYESLDNYCIEHAFISYTNDSNLTLNEENIDYKWCEMEEFLNLIKWFGNKDELREKIEKFLVK